MAVKSLQELTGSKLTEILAKNTPSTILDSPYTLFCAQENIPKDKKEVILIYYFISSTHVRMLLLTPLVLECVRNWIMCCWQNLVPFTTRRIVVEWSKTLFGKSEGPGRVLVRSPTLSAPPEIYATAVKRIRTRTLDSFLEKKLAFIPSQKNDNVLFFLCRKTQQKKKSTR